MRVPNDISAAAFWMIAAAVHPDAEIHLTGVGMNPTRAGVIDALRAMGADLSVEEERQVAGEPVADVVVRSSQLHGTVVEGDMVPRLIDEVPALAVAAAFASGATEIRDAAELRVKESDRVATVAAQLGRLGVRITEHEDGMTIAGGTGIAGGEADACGDHRLAMALAVAGLVSSKGVLVDGADAVAISYPDFWAHLEQLSEGDAQ
jgi:3-phosphoshikimate 1-carboxyvinyltransferase